MASKNPVPSRAALNALRGVILTTSCSVILLAEERRRRLQIARAAIDNARKLHMVQNNRGPIALAESHASWEARFAEVDDDVLSMASLPRPRTSTRRRGRAHLIGAENSRESHDHDSGRTQSTSRADRRNETGKSTTAADFIRNGLDMVSLDNLKITPLHSTKHFDLDWKAPRSLVQSNLSRITLSNKPSSTADVNTTKNESAPVAPESDEYEVVSDNTAIEVISSIDSARLYLRKQDESNPVPRPFYDDAVPALERLLRDIETFDTNKDTNSERLGLAIAIVQKVSSFGPPLPKAARPLRSQAIRLLHVVSLSCPENMTSVLTTILPLSKDPLKFLVPFMNLIRTGNHREVLRESISLFSQHPTSFSWARGRLVCRLLSRHARPQGNFRETKQLYLMLQDAGLFIDVEVPQITEYEIRKMVTLLALEHGDDSFAHSELQKLQNIDTQSCMSDMRLQQHLIARKASKGRWEEVFSDITGLAKRCRVDCVEFQNLLARVTDCFAQSHDAHELEAFLRMAVADYKLNLRHRWIYAVLDSHARHRQVESVFSWLQFCGDSGLLMDSAFNQKFFARCRKYWSFSDKTIQRLEVRLQCGSQPTKSQSNNPTEAIHGSAANPPADGLRSAVQRHLTGPNPDIQGASGLILSAYEKGHNVSEALTPLLMARLERGDDPSSLINDALQMGVIVHDSAYNKAAQALSAGGNHQAAIDMCKIAARENGQGELLYNEYNFANLVFAHTGSASYRSLELVLSGFTSGNQFWHGSRTCKESIKLAMKTTAMRTVAHTRNSESHRQALDRLDAALLHVKKCRSTKEERSAVSEAYVRLAMSPSAKAPAKATHLSKNTGGEAALELRVPAILDQPSYDVLEAASGSG
ncbi:hypothetical protein QQS21_008024 [Conoideocrella luteorostrata]|uniref:Pentatricopeptide repeat protein n=1 Tax=Conoideocrella luteorostrata TaxID=1105319 RepID=A0AAJ0CJK8_9HYPO|nr:hypothetical protein QQS21_008024 [Conoideocrella luteorostrata]